MCQKRRARVRSQQLVHPIGRSWRASKIARTRAEIAESHERHGGVRPAGDGERAPVAQRQHALPYGRLRRRGSSGDGRRGGGRANEGVVSTGRRGSARSLGHVEQWLIRFGAVGQLFLTYVVRVLSHQQRAAKERWTSKRMILMICAVRTRTVHTLYCVS